MIAAPIVLLEAAANSAVSALAAQQAGAARVELYAALELGGLAPSHAQIAPVRERLAIPLHVLIRPRAGDFAYSDLECETLLRDIEACAAPGCDGVVFGMLDGQRVVDRTRCRTLRIAAGRMGTTFHRAFDMVADQAAALEAVIEPGCERVLTSGGQPRALDGAMRIRALLAQADGRIAVMAGAGLDAELSDNGLDLLPGERATLSVHSAAALDALRHALAVRGLAGTMAGD